MKTIALLAVIAMWLQDLFGTKSSVGGPMTMMLIELLAMLAVGIYDAWSNGRGPFGWIVNIVAAMIGGFAAVALTGEVMETIRALMQIQGSLAKSNHPLLYIASAVVAISTVVGSWGAIRMVHRLGSGASALLKPR